MEEHILDAVARVNRQIVELLGPDPKVCIVYGFGTAHLLNGRGDRLFAFEDWDDPVFACDVCYAHLEDRLWMFFHGFGS